jgi:hypothetical protein
MATSNQRAQKSSLATAFLEVTFDTTQTGQAADLDDFGPHQRHRFQLVWNHNYFVRP